MKTLRILVIFWSACLPAVLAAAGEAPRETVRIESVLASVNGEAVTLSDVLLETGSEENQARALYNSRELPEQLAAMRRSAIDRIIDRRLLAMEFQRRQLTLPPQYLEDLIDEIAAGAGCRSRSEFIRKLRQSGASLEELRKRAEIYLRSEMVIGQHYYASAPPTPLEIKQYYDQHPEEFSRQETVQLQLLLLTPDCELSPDAAAALLQREPEKFGELVARYSSGPARDNGGDVGELATSRLRPEFSAVLTDRTAGKVYGPAPAEEGTYFLRLAAVHPASVVPFRDAESQIREAMEKTRRAAALEELKAQLRAEAVIEYHFERTDAAVASPVKAEDAKAVQSAEKAPEARTAEVKETQPAEKAPEARTAEVKETQPAEKAPEVQTAEVKETQPAEKAPENRTAEVKETQPAEKAPEVQTAEVKETKPAGTEPSAPAQPQPIAKEPNPMVTLKTNYGDVKIELFEKAAPVTVQNFLDYVKNGHYDNTIFHRVIDGFMIQGGGFDTAFKQKKANAPIKNEADNQISNARGTIAMARTSDPNSATCQFFINTVDNDFLDFKSPTPQFYGYCVFGKVVEGMEVVDKIQAVKTGSRGIHQDVPVENVVIEKAVID